MKELQLAFNITGSNEYHAFRAMVFLEIPEFDKCPFNTISTYNFTNESEILSISSIYANDFEGYSMTDIQNCTWKFTAPFEYKFKIDIHLSDISDYNPHNAIITLDNGDVIQIIELVFKLLFF